MVIGNTGEALIYTPFLGYGDLLYHTPFIRMLAKTYPGGVDVWAFNPEPFYNNPNIKNLFKMKTEHGPDPYDFYGDRVFHLSPERNPVCRRLYQAGNHMVDYISNSAAGLTLRPHEKSLELKWPVAVEDTIINLMEEHGLKPLDFIVVNPAKGWPSRTLPLEFYKEIISRFQANGEKVVLVGKTVDPKSFVPEDNSATEVVENEVKGLYPVHEFPGVIDLTNKLSFHECCCLYTWAGIAFNTENGNLVMSGVNDNPCWNLYIPSLTAPEFRLPYRRGDMYYKAKVVGNKNNYYPGSDYSKLKYEADFINAEVEWPTVEEVYKGYESIKRQQT